MDRLCQKGKVEFIKYLLAKAIIPQSPPLNIPKWTHCDIIHLPQSKRQEWLRATNDKLETLKKRKVYELVDRSKSRKVIKNKWVFDIKSDECKKVQLVACGFSQVEGIDFDQVFSPIVCFETVRLILALAALEDWFLTGVDVRNAYLYGILEEKIYMEQPEGFKTPEQEYKVFWLLRALYGLKQAGLVWWKILDKSMHELGFTCLKSDAGIFIMFDREDCIIVSVYVDNAIFAGSNKTKVFKAKEAFMKK